MLGFPEKAPLSAEEVIKDLQDSGELDRSALARFSAEKKKMYTYIILFGLFLTAVGSFGSNKSLWIIDVLAYGGIWGVIGIMLFYMKRRSELHVFMHSYGTEVPVCVSYAKLVHTLGLYGWIVKYTYQDLNQKEQKRKIKFQKGLHPADLPTGEYDSDGSAYCTLLHPTIATDIFKLKVEADIYNLRGRNTPQPAHPS